MPTRLVTHGFALALAAIFAADAFAVTLSSPGFELGPSVSEIRFSQTGIGALGWLASNTDGERMQATAGKPAAEGLYYASLLQNAGAYSGAALGVGAFGSTGFDRIYTYFSVEPNTTYQVYFQHASDNRFGYTAHTSVVEIVDAGTNATLSLRSFATPSLFNWQSVSFQFTSGLSTTNAAIAFTVRGAGNTSGVFDNVQISAVPEISTGILMLCGIAFGIPLLRRADAPRSS